MSFFKSNDFIRLSGMNRLEHPNLKQPSLPIDSILPRQVVKQILKPIITLGYND
jgi:hypothetical protein